MTLGITRALSAIAAASIAAVGSAQADDSATLWKLARKHEGRFVSELPSLQTTLTLRIPTDEMDLHSAKYDQAGGLLVNDLPTAMRSRTVAVSCKTLGTYVGKTAMGATAKVTRRDCDYLRIEDATEGLTMANADCSLRSLDDVTRPADSEPACRFSGPYLSVPMTPDQYRDIKRRGGWIELTFAPGAEVKNEVAEKLMIKHQPELDWPYDEVRTIWTVRGTIKTARLLMKDGVTEIVKAERR